MFSENCFNDFHNILWIYSTFEPQQYDTIGYSWKILQTKKKYFLIFYPSPSLATKPTDFSCSNSILRVPLQISPARFFFFFDLPLKLRVVYLSNKQTNSVTNIEFYKHVQYFFCCYVIKSAGGTAKKVLLSVIWNPLLIEINLSQIRTLDTKREKVCTVCPYLLFQNALSMETSYSGIIFKTRTYVVQFNRSMNIWMRSKTKEFSFYNNIF